MGYVMFWGLRLTHRVTWLSTWKKIGGKIRPAQSEVADNSWVLLVKKKLALDFQHKIMATYMSENFMIGKGENEDLNYALLVMHYHLEFNS